MQFKPNPKTTRLIQQHILEFQAMLEPLDLATWSRGDRLGRIIHTNQEGSKEIHGLDQRGLYYMRGRKRKRLPVEEVDAHVLRHIWHYWPELMFAENIPARPKKKPKAAVKPAQVVSGFVRGDHPGEIKHQQTGVLYRAPRSGPGTVETKNVDGAWQGSWICSWSASMAKVAHQLWRAKQPKTTPEQPIQVVDGFVRGDAKGEVKNQLTQRVYRVAPLKPTLIQGREPGQGWCVIGTCTPQFSDAIATLWSE